MFDKDVPPESKVSKMTDRLVYYAAKGSIEPACYERVKFIILFRE